ncbi:MAG: efflux RND transporter periplasmic adaptor subunit, partial [Kofleriaceae bacterium]
MTDVSPHPATTPTPGPSQTDDLGFPLPPPPRGSRIGVIVALAIIVGGGFAFGYLRKGTSSEARTSDVATETSAPQVETIKATVLSSDRALSLPGTVKPLEETKLFARVPGYVRAWHADIGDKVTAGQVLAEIDTPELAAELSQARAQLLSARAAVKQATAQRDYSRSN